MVHPSDRAAKRLAPPRAFLCALLLLSPAALADTEGSLRLSGAAGFDSNARRDYLQTGAVPDLTLSGVLAARGLWTKGGLSLQGRYDAGARKFLHVTSEDAFVQVAGVDFAVALGRVLRVGLTGQGKDRRGDRSYTDLLGGGFLEFAPDAQVELRLEARGHRYVYWPVFEYSFAAPELQAWARYRFDRRHSLFVTGELGTRRYNAPARDLPEFDPPRDLGQRRDAVFIGSAGYTYRGPFNVTVAYSFVSADSNSYGESLQRHRLSLSGALRLPAKLILLGDLAVQLTRYPDGVYLSQDYALQQDDESFNQVSLRLVRPLSPRFDLELSYALYYTRFPLNQLTYLRHVASLGLAFRL